MVCAMCVGMYGRSAKSRDEVDKDEHDLIDDDLEEELCDLERQPRGKPLTPVLATCA